MDSNKYNEACLQQLTDNEYYEEIEHDPNTEYRQVIDSTLDKMSAADLITDFESAKMKEGTRTPRFYGLPKITSSTLTFLHYAQFAVVTTVVQFASRNL